MPRHPLPPFQKRRALLLCAALSVLALQGALWSAAQKRRQLIRQQLAWRIPDASNWDRSDTLTLSADGTRVTCRFPSKQLKYDDWLMTFDAKTGDVVGSRPAPTPSSLETQPIAVESETRKGVRVWFPPCDESHSAHLRVSRNGHVSILTANPLVFSWRTQPYELRLSEDASLLTVVGHTALWQLDMRSQKILRVVRPMGTRNGQWSDGEKCTLSPDGQFLITLAPNPTLYDALTGRKVRSFGAALETQCGSCACIEPGTGFSPDGKLMWVSEEESGGNVAFWRVSDGKKMWQRVFTGWQFDPTGKYVISPSNNTIYSATTGKVVRHLKCPVAFDAFVFSSNGRQLYTLHEDGRIRHYRLP